ncbi:hypothetical protein [Helicobacter sp. T3_23-1056]
MFESICEKWILLDFGAKFAWILRDFAMVMDCFWQVVFGSAFCKMLLAWHKDFSWNI